MGLAQIIILHCRSIAYTSALSCLTVLLLDLKSSQTMCKVEIWNHAYYNKTICSNSHGCYHGVFSTLYATMQVWQHMGCTCVALHYPDVKPISECMLLFHTVFMLQESTWRRRSRHCVGQMRSSLIWKKGLSRHMRQRRIFTTRSTAATTFLAC